MRNIHKILTFSSIYLIISCKEMVFLMSCSDLPQFVLQGEPQSSTEHYAYWTNLLGLVARQLYKVHADHCLLSKKFLPMWLPLFFSGNYKKKEHCTRTHFLLSMHLHTICTVATCSGDLYYGKHAFGKIVKVFPHA